MNILLLNHYANTPAQSGGTRHYDLAREWVKSGHSVTIVAADSNHLVKPVVIVPPDRDYMFTDCDGINYCWVRTPRYEGNASGRLRNMLTYSYRALGLLKTLARPDVVIGSSVHPFAALSAWYLARRWKLPFVFEVRDLWPKTLVEIGSVSPAHPLIWVLGWLERFLYRRAVRIVTLLPGSQEHIVRIGGDAERIVCIPNGVVLGPDPSPPPAPNERFTILYAGAHGVPNHLDLLLDAAALLQAQGNAYIHFVLVGDGNQKALLRQVAKERNLSNVEFRSPVPKAEVRKLLEQADALFLIFRDFPLYKYGVSPNKLFDYLAAGRPLLLSMATGHPALEAGVGVVVRPEDAAALADGAKRLAALSHADRELMGKRGRRFAEENHGVQMLAERFLGVLRESTGG